ncbi:MAG: aldo/keto reductase [Bacteroidales bacterium]|nr:MAG: aldo/keto reductase [Bacteroidales bacterium]
MSKKAIHNRRQFLKKGIKSAALAAVIPASIKRKDIQGNDDSSEEKFVYRTLGRTGIKIPIVSMGTGDTNNKNLVQAALDKGIKLFATSQYYGNGNNEKMLGELIRSYDRNSAVVITSGWPGGVNHREGLFTEEAKTEPYIKSCENSLKNLGLDYIDIFLLPFAAKRESVFYEPLLKAMEQIKKQGLAKYIGIATHSWEQEAIDAAVETGIYDVAMVAYNFKKENIGEINKAIENAAKSGVGIIAMKTMAGAFWDKEKTLPINTKASLKWALQNENIHTAVPGITTFDQLAEDIDVMSDLNLTDKEKADLKLAQRKTENGIYCQQCAECIDQCPEFLDIPTLMRSYMYAYGYRNTSNAKATLANAGISSLPCPECDFCKVECTMGFNIKQKIMDIARLNKVPDDFLI